jgi:hypothetical protein
MFTLNQTPSPSSPSMTTVRPGFFLLPLALVTLTFSSLELPSFTLSKLIDLGLISSLTGTGVGEGVAVGVAVTVVVGVALMSSLLAAGDKRPRDCCRYLLRRGFPECRTRFPPVRASPVALTRLPPSPLPWPKNKSAVTMGGLEPSGIVRWMQDWDRITLRCVPNAKTQLSF